MKKKKKAIEKEGTKEVSTPVKKAWIASKKAEDAWRKSIRRALSLEKREGKGERSWINVSISSEVKEALLLVKQHYAAKAEKKGKKFLYDDLFRCLLKQNPKTRKVIAELNIDL